jgi:DNA-binding transcriptional regulator GbsR (MarR family)
MSELDKEAMQFMHGLNMEGMDDTSKAIFYNLYLESEEMPMEELAKRTGYSLATVCNKIKFLEHTGLLKKTRRPGSKKIFVYMEKNFLESTKRHFISQHEPFIRTIKEKLPAIIEKHKNKAKSEDDKKKMKLLENLYKQAIKLEMLTEAIIKKIDELNK